jgi:DNA-binding NtrC family response regulator
VVAATNGDLDRLCEAGLFRRDLFYRLNVINLHLPPLRERLDDLPLLITHLIKKHSPPGEPTPILDEQASARLLAYTWPGNVRELENVIERAITLNRGGHITVDDLPAIMLTNPPSQTNAISCVENGTETRAAGSKIPTIADLEREHLVRVLDLTGGNRKRAAELLGINRRTLYRMAERFGIEL